MINFRRKRYLFDMLHIKKDSGSHIRAIRIIRISVVRRKKKDDEAVNNVLILTTLRTI